MSAPARVVVLGGGFAGLETAFHLRHSIGDRVHLTIVSEQPYFLFKPNTIYIPFGANPDDFKIPLERPARRKQIELIHDRALEIDLAGKQVVTTGAKVPYDHLVVACA